MKFVVLLALTLVGIAYGAPQAAPQTAPQTALYSNTPPANVRTAPPQSSEEDDDDDDDDDDEDLIPILKDDRVHQEDGRFNVEVETGNGIHLSQGGGPDGVNGSVVQAGEYSYTAPDGTPVVVKFVADENGFQPQSDQLPVPPAFPHPIPQFVLDQIAFAAAQHAEDDSDED